MANQFKMQDANTFDMVDSNTFNLLDFPSVSGDVVAGGSVQVKPDKRKVSVQRRNRTVGGTKKNSI